MVAVVSLPPSLPMPALESYVPSGGRPAPSVYLRRRMVAVVLALLVLATLVLAARLTAASLGGVSAPAPEAALAQPGATIVVEPGESLWTIARRLQPHGDVRPLVAELAAANGGSQVRVGQRLVLP